MAPKRQKKAPPPPPIPHGPQIEADSDFLYVEFGLEEQRVRFQRLKHRHIIPTRFLCLTTLNRLGIYHDMHQLFCNIGLGKLFKMHEHTYADLTLEFLSSFDVVREGGKGLVTI